MMDTNIMLTMARDVGGNELIQAAVFFQLKVWPV